MNGFFNRHPARLPLLGLAMLLLACVAGNTLAGEYWPADDQGLFIYDDGGRGSKRCEVFGAPEDFTYTFQNYPFSIMRHKANFGFDRGGNLLLTRFLDSVGGVDAVSYGYDRPVMFLAAGLQVGDSWQHSGVCTVTDAGPVAFTAEFTVLSRQTVTVTAGTFETLQVAISGLIPYYLCGVYYLHSQLGPVKINEWELVSWKGVVPTSNTSWGGVKAIFR